MANRLCFLLLVMICHSVRAMPVGALKEHAITLPGTPKYPADFKHFDYVNPNAPKGGEFSESVQGNFNNLNPYSINGNHAVMSSLLYDKLMHFSIDEPYTAYGLVAESVERARDNRWVIFNLRQSARFHDGKPVTAKDVAFSYNILTSKGDFIHKVNFTGVESVEILSPYRILFRFKDPGSRKLPFLLASLPVLSEHYWSAGNKDFSKTTLDIPVGSGPYRIKTVKPGREIVYTRDPDYWGKDLPVNRGRFNFDQLRFEYINLSITELDTLKGGSSNFLTERVARTWHTAYDFPAVRQGDIIKERIRVKSNIGMNAFIFNTRRPPLDNRKVREALILLFDFEWLNKHLMFGEYTRNDSYFVNTDMAARGLPSSNEIKLLEPYSEQLAPEVLAKEYQPPKTDGSGNNRKNIAKAIELLKAEGWELEQGKMIHQKSGQPMELKILNQIPQMGPSLNSYKKSLDQAGVQLTIQALDTNQIVHHTQKLDYDLINWGYGHAMSPGKEMLDGFGCETRDKLTSRNRSGICDPVIDSLINKTEQAQTREELVTIIQALDRVLLWGHYGIPKWYMESIRIAHRRELKHPGVQDLYDMDIHSWWYETDKK